jgi:hypothetical protein
MKKCLVCNFQKPIKKEHHTNPPCLKYIHEYNYSCYECLDNMAKQKEKELRDIYDKMKLVGII